MRFANKRKTFTMALGLILAALLSFTQIESASADKKKTRKNKKNNTAAATTALSEDAPAAGLSAPPAAVLEAQGYLLAYDVEAARRALESGAPEDNAWTVTARGRILEMSREYQAATGELRKAADLDTRNPAPVLFLGDAYAYDSKRGQADDAYAQAEARARSLVEAKSDDPDALYFLGVAQQRLKRFADAATTLEKASSLRPEDATILYQLGVTKFYQDRFQPAFDLLSQALDKNSGIAYAYYYRGLAAGKLDRKDLLFNDLDRFVKLAPDAPEAATANQILASFS